MSKNIFFNNDFNDNNNNTIENSFMNNQFIKQEDIEEEPSFNFNNSDKPKNKPNIKALLPVIFIIIILIIVVILLLKGVGNVETFSNHTNNTDSKDYNDNDVSYNCTYTNSNENRTLTENSDILYDFKKGDSTYQVFIYNKITVTYNQELNDEAFRKIIDELDNTICGLNEEECKTNHIEANMTNLGWNTVVDRKDNKIIITFNNSYGIGKKATKEIKEKAKSDLESEGYICN